MKNSSPAGRVQGAALIRVYTARLSGKPCSAPLRSGASRLCQPSATEARALCSRFLISLLSGVLMKLWSPAQGMNRNAHGLIVALYVYLIMSPESSAIYT